MAHSKLITDNPELLHYIASKLHITVLGGIKFTGLDRMKVTLKMVVTDNKQNVFRHNLDLYNSIQVGQLVDRSAEALDYNASGTVATAAGNLVQGNYKDAALAGASEIAFNKLGKGIEALKDAGKITKVDKTLLGAVSLAGSKTADVFIDKSKTEAKGGSEKSALPKIPLPQMKQDNTKPVQTMPVIKKTNNQ